MRKGRFAHLRFRINGVWVFDVDFNDNFIHFAFRPNGQTGHAHVDLRLWMHVNGVRPFGIDVDVFSDSF